MAEIDDHAWEKPRFRCAEEKAHPIKLRRRVDESRQNCQHPPNDHDSGDAAARAPLFHQQGAGNFEKAISNEENARAKTVNFRSESQSVGHFQRGKRNVYAVQVRNDIQQKQIGHDPPRDAASRAISWRTGRDHFAAGERGIKWKLGRVHEAAFVSIRSLCAAWPDVFSLVLPVR